MDKKNNRIIIVTIVILFAFLFSTIIAIIMSIILIYEVTKESFHLSTDFKLLMWPVLAIVLLFATVRQGNYLIKLIQDYRNSIRKLK